ncbi:MAG: AAA family ATPase [Gemmatimonadota bacterium]|nr:AAA family ATPase [Gemmatimonadota bacterium]MDH3426885.1 AAA family ATPase [Gemmatimonadota bacterium]
MTDAPGAFVPFFSHLQLDRLRAGGVRDTPTRDAFSGALLLIDIVGFSGVTERLGEQGAQGAELLSGVLHAYFEPILASLREHGGDVLFFAGDAVGVLWKAPVRADLGETAIRAAQCALEIQALVGTIDPPWGSPLQFRAALGAGDLEAIEIGGVGERWLQVVRGDALDRCRLGDQAASGGDVIVDTDLLELLEPADPVATPVEGGHHFRLTELRRRIELRPLAELDLAALPGELLSNYLPKAVAWRIQTRSDLMAEFRQVTVLFLNLVGPGAAAEHQAGVETLQQAVVIAQKHIDRLEGVLYQLLEDDKGANLIAVFGLPGTSHEDDPMRAVLAGRGILAAFEELGLSPSGGIATGQVYCGLHGDELRKRYSVIGSTINLSARLMTLAPRRGLLCDETTRILVGPRIEFADAGSTTPKGFPAPVAMFVPGAEVRIEAPAALDQDVVGRKEEIAAIAGAMDAVMHDGTSRAVVISGEAGMGKSTLVQVAKQLAGDRGLTYLHGAADSFETGTAYYALRSVARDWFGIEPGDDQDRAGDKVTEAFEESATDRQMIPLLGSILGFDFRETEASQQLRGQARAAALRDLLLRQAVRRALRSTQVLAIEDGHWLDEASWSLLPELVDRVPRLLIILTTRPMANQPPEFDALTGREESEVRTLPPFDHAFTEELIRTQLGVSTVSEAAVEFVTRRAAGNPFFARELLRSLEESGGLRIRGSMAELAQDGDDAAPVPATLEGVITSRIDRVDPDIQVTVKVAAVLGRSFEVSVLEGIHPARPDEETLEHHLETLRQASLLVPGEAGGQTFTHALTQEAAYNLLSYAQRELLHRAAAETLESVHEGNLEQISARLGYHFRLGQVPDRAVPYLAMAGEAAVDAYASRDAIALLGQALELDETVRGPIDQDLNRARWCRLIGQAHYNQDQQLVAGDWYRRAIRLAGAFPRGRVLGAVGILGKAMLSPGRIGKPPRRTLVPEDRARMLEGLAAGRELAIVYMWDSSMGKFALNSLNQARVSSVVGLSAESADANATLGFLISAGGFNKSGERVALQAVEMAEAAGDLRQTVSVLTIAGMLLEQNGRAAAGLPYLRRCNELAANMQTGMYRHRARYMLSDTLAVLGRWDEARECFEQTAELARVVEPHTAGMATAMVALSHLRQGRPQTAVDILEGPNGVASVLEGGVGISIATALGVLAETRLALGDDRAALEVVRQAESLISRGDDGTAFYSSIFGHSALAAVRLAANEPGEPVRWGRRKRAPLDLALARVAKIARTAPGAGAWLALLRGLDQVRRDNPGRARRLFETAIERAEAAGQPYELGRSLLELARVSDDPDRSALFDRAGDVFERHGMTLAVAGASAELKRE